MLDYASAQYNQIAKVHASDAGRGDHFGLSVSMPGDTAIVGVYQNDDRGPYTGLCLHFSTR